MRSPSTCRRVCQVIALLVCSLALPSTAHAQVTWTGSNGLWNGSNTWTTSLGAGPGFSQSLVFTGNTLTSSTNNYTSGTVTGLTFLSSAGTFTLSGSAFTLNGNVTNNSSNTQTIQNNVFLLNNNSTFSGTAITLSGTLTNSGGNRTLTSSLSSGQLLTLGSINLSEGNTGRIFTLAGTGNTAITGSIGNGGTGASQLVVTNTGTTTITGGGNWSGNTTVNTGAGSLIFGSTAGANTGTSTYVLQGGRLILDNTGSGNNVASRIADASAIQIGGGSFIFRGSDQASTNSAETVGAITWNPSNGVGGALTVSYGGTNTATLTVASMTYTAGYGSLLVNGQNLGMNNTATGTVGKIIVTTAPTLVGTTAAQTSGINSSVKNTQIVPFLVGEATATTGGLGTATGTANTFVTYVAGSGLRPLNPADEFTNNAITGGNNTYITAATSAAATASINSLVLNGGDLSIASGQTLTNASGAILFASSNAIAGPGSLTFGNNQEAVITRNPGVTGTISAPITATGVNNVTFSGAGTLALTASNSYTGTTTISGGVLNYANPSALGTGPVAFSAAATLQSGVASGTVANTIVLPGSGTTATFDSQGNSNTLSGTISGAGNFTKIGAGTLTLAAANTYTGTTIISAGTLALSGGNNRLATTGTVSFAGNGGLNVSGSQSLAVLTLANNVSATLGGSGTVAITGTAFSVTATGSATSQTLDASGLAAFAYTNSGGSFKVGGSNGNGVSTGRFVLPNTASITASTVGIGTDAGPPAVNSGTLTLGTTTTISSNTITLGNAQSQGTVNYSGASNPMLTLRASNGTGPVANMTIGSASSAYQGTMSSVLDLSTNVTGASTLDAVVTNLLIGESSRSTSFGQSMTATGGLRMQSGTLTATTITLGQTLNAPTFTAGVQLVTGSLSVSGGTVNVSTLYLANQNWTSGTVTGVFTLGGGGALNAATIASGTGAGLGSAVRTFNWNDGTISTLDAATDLSIGSGITFNLASTGTHRFSIGTGRSGTMASALVGAGGTLEKAGAGTLLLSASSSYSGGSTLSAGTLSLGNTSALGATTGPLALNAGTLNLAGFSPTVGALSGSSGGTITTANAAATATLTTSFASGTSTYAGSIADNGSGLVALTKGGAGTLALSASNAYSGGTQLNGGVLSLGAAGALGSSGTISFGGGTLQFTASDSGDYSARFSTSASQAYALDTNGQSVTLGTALTSSGGSLTKSGAGTLTLTQDATFSGTTTVTGGTLALGSGGTAGSVAGRISLAAGASLVVNRSSDLALSGAITGTGSLTKQGVGTLTLTQGSAVASLALADPAGATSTVLTQSNLTVTSPVTLGASSGTARLYLLPATAAANTTATFSGGITVNAGGMLSLGGFNPTGGAAVAAGLVSGNVTIAGGILDLPALVKQGTAANFQGSSITGDLSMSSGTLQFVDAGLRDRRLTVTGNFSLTGGSVTVDNTFSTLQLSGSSINLAPTSFDTRLTLALQASGPQSLATAVPLGLLRPRGTGVKTISSSAVGTSMTTLAIMDADSSQTAGVTAQLASNLSMGSSPYVEYFGNSPTSGRVDAGLDAAAFTLTIAGTFTPNASTQSGVTNTYWTLSGTAGTMRAAAFNLGSGSTTVDVGAGLVLTSTGGNSAANVLSGSGTISATSIFRYAGSAAAGTPASLVSTRAIGDLEVTSGALRVTGLNGAQAARVTGGTLDLANAGYTFTSAQLTGGSITSGTLTTAGGFDLRSGIASAVLAGAGGLSKTTSGTVALSGVNTYAGATSIAAGTLLVNGDQSAAIGAVTVDAGATLGGSGSIGGATTVNGILSPGNSPGVLTLAQLALGATSTTLMEITGTARGSGYDGLNISQAGGLTYGGALSLSFTTTFSDNTTFNLFNFSGLATGNFSSVAAVGPYGSLTFTNDGLGVWTTGSTNVAGQTMTFTQATGELVIVPEPAGLLLVGLGAGVVAWRRRRRT